MQRPELKKEGPEGGGEERTPSLPWRIIIASFTAIGLLLAINYVFRLRLLGNLEFESSYLYSLYAVLLSPVFIVFRASKRSSGRSVPWYDLLLFGLTFAISAYFASIAFEASQRAWDVVGPPHVVIVGGLFCLLVLEAVRRAGGLPLLAVVALFATYPLFAGYMPGFLGGVQLSLSNTITFHTLGPESLIGIISSVFGNLLVGFIFFAVILMRSGAGTAFMDFALALLGRQRGGPAKVAVVASGFFGGLSGSVISNILTTGSFTIPTMKKTGYPSHYASAVEAVASTGGNFMPPVMGASAFVMAVFLGIPYLSVVTAAIIPALLYYFALFMQVHFYAISHNLRGIPNHDIPPLKHTLKEIWPSILSILVLVFFLYLGLEGRAPFAAGALLLALSMRKKEVRENLKGFFFGILEDTVRQLARLAGMLVGIGFIMGSFAATGLASSFAHELMMLAGGSLALMLIFCALASFILGTGMPVNACYIFLAVTIAPALEGLGIVPIAAHLFIFYWGMASYLTPPVAEGAYVAATLGKANFFKTGLMAMRLGIIVYLVPFCFVLEPSLLFRGKLVELIVPLITMIIGIFWMATGLEGWFPRIGFIPRYLRFPLFASGVLFILSESKSDIAGIGLFVLTAAVYLVTSRIKRRNRVV